MQETSQQSLDHSFQDRLQNLKRSFSQRLYQQSSQQTRQRTIKQGELPIKLEVNRIQYQDMLRFNNKWISKKEISWKKSTFKFTTKSTNKPTIKSRHKSKYQSTNKSTKRINNQAFKNKLNKN